MKFSLEELEIITNQDFLLLKRRIISNIESRFVEDIKLIHKHLSQHKSIHAIPEFRFKLSKGENYRGLPYIVFDHPNFFTKETTIAFRTMFWWGNHFSATIHLGGDFLESNRQKLITLSKELEDQDVFLCVNETPWEYHFEPDNYIPFTELNESRRDSLLNRDFVKISIRSELTAYSVFLQRIETLYNSFLKLVSST